MALILKAYTSVQRKFICKDLNNLLRTLPLITQNGYHVEVKVRTFSQLSKKNGL